MPEPVKKEDEQQPTSTNPNTKTEETPTDIVPNSPTTSNDRELIALYDQVMRDREEENKRLRAELEAERSNRNQQPDLTPEEQKAKFFNEPASFTREIVQREIKEAIAPLIEFTSTFRAQNQYEQLKSKYRNAPQFRDVFPKIEAVIDKMMANAEKNDATMQTAIFSAMGMLQAGMLPGVSPNSNSNSNSNSNQNPNPNSTNSQVVTPPHLRSDVPAQPTNGVKKPSRELNENEKRLARMRGMTDEQYLNLLGMPAAAVATSKRD